MKKIYVLLLAVVIMMTMCSCKEKTFKTQANINFNYNNVVASNMYWIDNDAVYFTEDYIFIRPLFKVTEHGKEVVSPLIGGRNAMEYNDKLYVVDSGFPLSSGLLDSSLTEYDIKTKKTKTFSNLDYISNFFIIDDECFILSGLTDEYKVSYDDYSPKDINKLSLKTEDVTSIANDVFAFGVIENKCSYLTRDEDIYNLYQYDITLDKTVNLGSFEIQLDNGASIDEAVNFTSNYVVLIVRDYEEYKTSVYIYDFKNNILNEFEVLDIIEQLTAFDKFAYFDITYGENNLLYRLNFATLETELIESFYDGSMRFFVTSDNDVYVQISSNNDEIEEGLFHYNGTNRVKVMD